MPGSYSILLLLKCSVRYWRRHGWQAVLMLVGLALGVAVVFSVDLANQSAKRAFSLSLDAITGQATHQIVSGGAGVDESIYTRLRRELKFRAVAPVVEGAVTVQSANGSETLQLLGIDLFAEPMFRTQLDSLQNNTLTSSRTSLALLELGGVILGNTTAERLGFNTGDSMAVKVLGKNRQLKLVGLIDTDRQAAFDSIAMTDISTAQWLLDMPGKLSRIDLIIDSEQQISTIENAFDSVSVVDASRRNNALQQMTQAFHTNLVAMSLLALLVGGFLIYNTVTLSVLQRRFLFGQLRVAGVDRMSLAAAIIIEAMVFVLVGIVVGLLAGYALGALLLDLVTRTINDLYFTLEVRQLHVSAITVVKVVAMAIVAALVAVIVPAREAANSPPITLTRQSSLEIKADGLLPWLFLSGCAAMFVGFLVLWLSTTLLAAFVSLFLIVIGYSLLIPGLLKCLVIVSGKFPFAGTGVTGSYPVRSLSASLSRIAVAVTALAVAVSATTGVGIMIGSFRASVADWLDQTLQADIYIRDSESLNNAIPEAFVKALNDTGATLGTRLARTFDIEAAGLPATLLAVEYTGSATRGLSLLDADVGVNDQWRAWSQPRQVFVSEPLAWQQSLSVGEEIDILTEKGSVAFSIAGVFTDYGAGRGLIIISMQNMHSYWSDRSISSVGVMLNPAIDEAADDVRTLVKRWPALLPRSDGDIRAASMRIFDQTFAITHILRLLTTGVAFVGILSALLALTLERRREFAVLRALGLTPAELRLVLFTQTSWMGVVAGLLALPLGILMSAVLVAVINQRSFGWTMQYLVEPTILWQSIALSIGAALFAAVYPAWRLGYLLPSEALRD